MAECHVCFRKCRLDEGQVGSCGARVGRAGTVQPLWYGKISSLALDPIEKKPLYHFHPGSKILSVGSLGCNLHCPFCQNHWIAQADKGNSFRVPVESASPEKLAAIAASCRPKGSIGIAFTYNEPLVGYEFVRDTAMLVRREGMLNVLVTNGTAGPDVLDELAPHIDAMNIDLKGFTDRYYSEVLRGSRQMAMDFIREAVRRCHVELTTLIVPGENDTEEEMLELSAWIAGLEGVSGHKKGREIPLHISRFFPRWHMTDRQATDPRQVYRLVAAAKQHLQYVYPGNC